MNYDPTYYDGLYKCNIRLLRSLARALGVSYTGDTAKVSLIASICQVIQ